GGLSGALVSVLGGQAKVEGAWSLVPPEAQGMRLLFRTAWPPGLAALGATPVLLARNAVDRGEGALAGAQPLAVPVIVVFVIAAWWRQSMEAATATQKEPTS